MAIRFACPSCRQPIEVDDNWANQSVGCPYCKKVVTAPAQSEWSSEQIHVAEPAGGDPNAQHAPPYPPQPQQQWHGQPYDPHAGHPQQAPYPGYGFPALPRKSTCAWMALILMFLYIGFTFAGVVILGTATLQIVQDELNINRNPTFAEQQQVINKYILEKGRMPGNAASATAGVLALVAGLTGLILAIASLVRREARKVVAVISLIGCLTSFCCGGYLAMSNMQFPVPPQPVDAGLDHEAEDEMESEPEPEVDTAPEASVHNSTSMLAAINFSSRA
jgi:hypothetical protein